MKKTELETLLVRLREACLFLLKGDVLALGGLVTLVSVFKLDQSQVAGLASEYRWVLRSIAGLIMFGLLYEAFLTIADGSSTDDRRNQKLATAARVAYFLFAALQICVLAYVAGYLGGYLDYQSEHSGAL